MIKICSHTRIKALVVMVLLSFFISCGGVLSAPPKANDGRLEKAKEALAAAGTLEPVQGKDTNVVKIAQAIVSRAVSGITVTVTSTDNPQVSSNGTIIFGNSPGEGSVIFKLSRNGASASLAVPVTVPARTVTDADQMASAKASLAAAGTLKPIQGTDTNVVAMAQSIVDEAVPGVAVTAVSSSNPQVSSTGVITFGTTAASGNVNVRLSKNGATASQAVPVTVPARTVTDADQMASAKASLAAAGTLKPIQGTDTNVVAMAQSIVDEAIPGVAVTAVSSSNPQVSSIGDITYGTTAASGNVNFRLSKNGETASQAVPVTVPAKTATDTDQVASAKAALTAAGTLKPIQGTDTNVAAMAQSIVDEAVPGVAVTAVSSSNPQVSSTGDITYGSKAGVGSVTLQLTNNAAMDTVSLAIEVQAQIDTGETSCTALGMIKNDASKSKTNTALLLKAVNEGRKISVDGIYYLGYSDVKLADTQVCLTGETPDAEFKIPDGIIFYVNNNVDINVNGIKFTHVGSSVGYLFRFASNCLSNTATIDDCAFQGNIRGMWYVGSTTIDPSRNWFGIRELYFTNNTVNDTRTAFLVIPDMPSDKIVIEGNSINNFDCEFISSGIVNGITYSEEMYDAKKLMVVRDNTVTCDEDWWGDAKNTSYYCFVLFEGSDCVYTGNHIEGLKFSSASGSGACIYDSYLSCENLDYSGNVWKNNLSFNPAKTNNTLLKSKSGPVDAGLTRHYENNTYVIEESFIKMCSAQLATRYSENVTARLATDLSAAWVELLSLTHECSSYEIINNQFEIYDLRMNYQNAVIEEMIVEGNTFRCDKIGGTLFEYGAAEDKTNFGDNICIVSNNMIEAESLSKTYFNIVGVKWSNTVKGNYGTVQVEGNDIQAPCTYYLSNTNVQNAFIKGNKVQSAVYKSASCSSNITNNVFQDNIIN